MDLISKSHILKVAVTETPPTPARNDKKKKKKISVLDISGPVSNSFVHVSGVKTDGSGGMKMVDKRLRKDQRNDKFKGKKGKRGRPSPKAPKANKGGRGKSTGKKKN